MATLNKLRQQLVGLDEQREGLLAQLHEVRANKRWRCVCGRQHRFKDTHVLRIYHYIPPRGCTEGDYWKESQELSFVCPASGKPQRMWLTHNDVPYDKRVEYDYNLYRQLSSLYLPVTAKVENFCGDRDGPWNHDLVNNRLRYGLSLKDVDSAKTPIHYE